MKILQIVYPGLGGTGSVSFSVVEGQKHRKYINVFLFVGIEKLITDYKKKCKKLNINFEYIHKKRYHIQLRKILVFLKKTKPKIIIIHEYNILPFYIFSLFNKTKLIYVSHTPDKTKKIRQWVLYIFNSFFCHNIILVSKRNKNDFKYKINNLLFKKKVTVIENGINIKKFSNE